jgi:hypothetical protein
MGLDVGVLGGRFKGARKARIWDLRALLRTERGVGAPFVYLGSPERSGKM